MLDCTHLLYLAYFIVSWIDIAKSFIQIIKYSFLCAINDTLEFSAHLLYIDDEVRDDLLFEFGISDLLNDLIEILGSLVTCFPKIVFGIQNIIMNC